MAVVIVVGNCTGAVALGVVPTILIFLQVTPIILSSVKFWYAEKLIALHVR